MNSPTLTSHPTPMRGQMRAEQPALRTTYQFKGHVTNRAGSDELSLKVVNLVLKWAKCRINGRFPREAWAGESFSTVIADEAFDCVAISSDRVWSFRWSHPDKPLRDVPAVPGRTWVTEIAVNESIVGEVTLGVRCQCISRSYATDTIMLTRPKIVQNLANEFNLSESRRIDSDPWVLDSETDLDLLEQLLCDHSRTMPVYLLTQPDQSKLEKKTEPYMLNHNMLARRSLGLAYVVAIPWDLAFRWTERVGRMWAAFNGAVRTYMPGLDFEESSTSSHPLALAEGIQWYKRQGNFGIGEKVFLSFLVDFAHQYAAQKSVDWAPCIFFTDARTRKLELSKAQAAGDTEWRLCLEHENAASDAKNMELSQEMQQIKNDMRTLREELNWEKGENRKLCSQLETMRFQFESKTGKTVDETDSFPAEYEDIPDWIDKHLSDRLVLHPRAANNVKKSEYADIERVCRSLQLLAREYRDMRRGLTDSKGKWDRGINELHLEYSRSISVTRAGEKYDTYTVEYPPGSGKKVRLESHLKKGNSRESKDCLRIYFFWDAESERAVVGWLTSHLATRST